MIKNTPEGRGSLYLVESPVQLIGYGKNIEKK